jgi:hypothetical protein
LRQKKENISITIDPEILKQVRNNFPGASTSTAIENTLRLALLEQKVTGRMRNIETITRAMLIMLSEYIAAECEDPDTLRFSAVQRALGELMRVEKTMEKEGGTQNSD